ncbi:hypothetical protein [Bacillus thuringiensis]|uniref:hypothetical protein n=1 Tax=Bacillus thuringiensis TaxID=1428 RepID=UPI003BF6A7B2
MNKWVKSLTAMALASSLLMVGCSKGEDKKKEDDQQHNKRIKRIKKQAEPRSLLILKRKNKVIIKLPLIYEEAFLL